MLILVFATLRHMSIIFREYREHDRKELAHCIGQLQDYVASLDPLHRIRRLKVFDVATYITRLFEQVEKHDGVVFIAKDRGKMVGCIVGVVHQDNPEIDIERYQSINAKILELIVLPEYRGQRVGNKLMQRMEKYFASKNCDVITVECFAPNKDAYRFYEKLGYTDRLFTLIKPLRYLEGKKHSTTIR